MTLGEKLKQARRQSGLSQEQLAEKLNVSRSAVAKWETDKGMPDIENIKAIAQLLDVSIDYLLTEEEKMNFGSIKEPINPDDYEKKGLCRSKKDAAVAAKYPSADTIYALKRDKKLSKAENILEWTVMPFFGLFDFADKMNNSESYYLVEQNGRQYLVSVSDEFIVSTELARKITEKKFIIADYKFSRLYRLTD